MIIERKHYLDKLIAKRENGLIKVITGIRRCGKSFLLFELYRTHLIASGDLCGALEGGILGQYRPSSFWRRGNREILFCRLYR